MSTPNPYAAPKAPVADQAVVLPGNFTPGGRARPAGNGWRWIAEGWRAFMKAPGTWIAIAIVLFVIFFALAFIPFIGGIALSLLAPVFVAGVVLGCQALAEGRELEFRHLFAGFQAKLGKLVAVGAITFGLSFAIMLVVMLVTGAGMFAFFGAGGPQNPAALSSGMLLGVLLALLFFVPLAMAMWFAAPLVVLNELAPVDALKQSFSGCLRNIVPFLVYGVVMFVLAVLATLPLGLGWLVLMPIAAGSLYASYRDIYLG